MDEKRSYAAPAIVFGLLLLIGGYAGSYFALVERGSADLGRVEVGIQTAYFGEYYRYGGSTAKLIFYPIHLLDRQLRPDYWDFWKSMVKKDRLLPSGTKLHAMPVEEDGVP